MKQLEKLITFSKKHRLATHLIFWLAVLVLAVGNSSYYHPDFSLDDRVVNGCIPLITQIIAAYFLGYTIIPQLLAGKNYGLTLFILLAGTYLICALSRVLIIYVSEPYIGEAAKKEETIGKILTDWWKLVYVYFFLNFSVAFVFVVFKLLKDYITIQAVSHSLEKQKTETELKLLKTQLNPHFLFNTLNNIFSLAVVRSEDTAAAVARLSEILDYMLYRCSERYVPISGEIKLLQNYIGLEQLRYDERLYVSLHTTIHQDVVIAPLILLSVVENAFKHGAAHDSSNCSIIIDLEANRDGIKFSCSNSYKANNRPDQGGHIGLQNIRSQLDLLYAGEYSLDIRQDQHIFTVSIRIGLDDIKWNDEN